LEFLILGPLVVLNDGVPLLLGGAKPRGALAILLLGRNEVVSRDRLIDGLWGDSPPASAAHTLETYMSRLRKALHVNGGTERLLTRPPGYLLRVEDGELDLEHFESLLNEAKKGLASGDPWSTREGLREALSLFRGAPLEDLGHAPFAPAEIERLEELRLGALQQRLHADLAVGQAAEVVGELESLVARFPFREHFWEQLMLALYRSGRQRDALIAFDRARGKLVDELGVDPGQSLQQLQRRILEQDPSLEPVQASAMVGTSITGSAPSPAVHSDELPSALDPTPASIGAESPTPPPYRRVRPRRRHFHRGQRAVAAGVSLILVLAVLAIVIPRVVGGGGEGGATYSPGSVLIDLATGKQIGSISPAELAVAAYPIFADGHFWVNNWEPNAYVEIDPRTGTILKQVSPPAREPSVHGDNSTVTPFAVEGDTLWVNSADDLVEMDVGLGKEVKRFHLDDYEGLGSGLVEGIAVGGGSVWVSRDVGQGQILRLDPFTGKPEHVWDNVRPYVNLVYGDGSLWTADDRGIARIDPETDSITGVSGIQGNCGSGGCVVAGAGFGWTSHGGKGVVYKVDEGGHISETYPTGIGTAFLSYTEGILWVANYDEGTVKGLDGVTGETTTTYRFGHPVDTMAAGGGVLLAYLDAGIPIEDHIDALTGRVAKLFAHAGELGDEEPALNTDPGAYQIEFATCAKLLNYPDELPPDGWTLRPEVAAALPTISPDGRTYVFTIRPGYRFSPPSNQPVTAETFRYSIERALSPALAEGPTVSDPPGPHFLDDIEGERAFRDGGAEHISGLRATGTTLSITLTKPSPDFLERLALPYFCPVPTGTPFVAGAPHGVLNSGEEYIVSAGPYYVADYNNDEYVILKRNPNYHGPRPQALDAIAIREDVDASGALDGVQNQGWDGISSLSDPVLSPGGAVDQRWGPESSAAADGDQRYFLTPAPQIRFIAFNASRGIFADPRVRRAAALALDRRVLAKVRDQIPADQFLSPAFRWYQDRVLYPTQSSVAEALTLMDGRGGNALMPVPSGCDQCLQTARAVQTDLGAIGIDVRIQAREDFGAVFEEGGDFDLLDGGGEILYPDPASFLTQMLLKDLPPTWLAAGVRADVERLATLSSDGRQAAAAALADRLAIDDVPVAAYGTAQSTTFVGPRMGCRVFSQFSYGLDLAALCIDQLSG
jgi:DNA-binding SARP family transcriptional activator/ABC-type transport system substrate-binding protein